MTELGFLVVGLLVGAGAAWVLARGSAAGTLAQAQALQREVDRLTADLGTERGTNLEQTRQIAALEADYRNLEDKLLYQQDTLSSQFKNLANDLLEEKSRRFTEQNRSQLDQILAPLGEKIRQFEQRVEETYDREVRDKISLREEVRKLYELNARISDEANNLARALRGDTKQQGNWGEVILEKVLERSGLRRDAEYRTQVYTYNSEREVIRPDVVVYLPDGKHLVIDAKVSLTAYERCIGCENEDERHRYLASHLASVRNHVKLLGEKRYETAEGLITPEFVLLFMPIESAFSLAVQGDAELFNFAWDRRIVLVSPTTLLATLRTVASIWKFEKQSKHAIEIARLSGELYDKLATVLDDLTRTGRQLEAANGDYREAMKRLYEGKGNVVRTAEKLKALGARATKTLPQSWVDRAEE
jgi:DNA recombination protein RmuC